MRGREEEEDARGLSIIQVGCGCEGYIVFAIFWLFSHENMRSPLIALFYMKISRFDQVTT